MKYYNGRWYKRIPIEERFWKKVKKTKTCWLWTAGTACGFGYGILSHPSRIPKLAHRFSYELHKGPIPKGKEVMHSCDIPTCVNPGHLRIGTHLENVNDCVKKLRHSFGDRHFHRKLSSKKVKKIKRLFYKGVGDIPIAKRFNVHHKTINDIRNLKTWKHIHLQLAP